MSLTLKDIAKGMLHGRLPTAAGEDLARERMKLCEGCSEFARITRQCKLCGCFLDLKTKMLDAECPSGKW